jgi:hypothetical protein
MKNHNFFGFDRIGMGEKTQNINDLLTEIESFFDEKSFDTSMHFVETKN